MYVNVSNFTISCHRRRRRPNHDLLDFRVSLLVRLGVLAHSCLTPGLITLIYFFTTSFASESVTELRKQNASKALFMQPRVIEDYVEGCSQSIITTCMSKFFCGLKFWEVAG